MASSKKSLSDKFALEAKKKSPAKQSKKEKKAAKSLSRELLKPSTSSPKKKAQKSHSDSSVVPSSCKSEEPDLAREPLVKVGLKSKNVTEEARSEVTSGDTVKFKEQSFATETDVKTGKEIKAGFESPRTIRSTFNIGSILFPSHTIEKLEPSLKETWHKPPPTPGESPECLLATSTPKTVRTSAEIHLKPRESVSGSSSGSLLSVSSFSSAASSKSESTASVQSVDSISSELDTIVGEEIDISECSSTSTPIRFTLHEEKSEKVVVTKSHKPPKFSLIREAKIEDFDALSSSGLSPTSTSASLKSNEFRNRIDDFSDDSDGSKLRESSEFSDDMQEVEHHTQHFVPLNKQLQIVTSMDRLIDRYLLSAVILLLHQPS